MYDEVFNDLKARRERLRTEIARLTELRREFEQVDAAVDALYAFCGPNRVDQIAKTLTTTCSASPTAADRDPAPSADR